MFTACLLIAGIAITASATTFVVDNTQAPVGGAFTYNSATDTLVISTSTGGYVLAPVDGATPTQPPPDPNAPLEITSFSVSPSPWYRGEETTFSWTVNNAVRCEFRRGNAQWREGTVAPVPTGSRQIVVDWDSRLRFNLRCFDAAGAYVDGSIVADALPERVVTASSCTKSDTEIPLKPTGVTRASAWNEVFSSNWPLPASEIQRVSVPSSSYVSLFFDTGNVADTGGIVPVTSSGSSGVRLISISPCEGDFDVPEACRELVGINGSVVWSTSGATGACPLQPNTRYFLNLTYTDGVTPSADCGFCQVDLQVNNLIQGD
jgi:hypothetical protein